jgi:hypothetical protein
MPGSFYAQSRVRGIGHWLLESSGADRRLVSRI